MDSSQLITIGIFIAGQIISATALWAGVKSEVTGLKATVVGNKELTQKQINGVTALVAQVVKDRESCEQRELQRIADHEGRLRVLEKG